MRKKELTKKEREAQWEKEDEELTLAPGADFLKRVNLDLPVWALKELDTESNRRGIARQALIKNWIIDRLDSLKKERRAS